MSAIRNRKRIASDETGAIWVTIFGDRLFVDVRLDGPFTLSNYKHWLRVRDELEANLRTHGYNRYYAIVDTYEKFRWTKFLGFRSNLETFGDVIEIMVKDF